MNTKNKQPEQIDDQPSIPSITPPGMGHPMFNVHQTCMDLQKSITEVNVNLANLIKTVDGIKTKVDDMHNWKNRILGGAMVLGILCAIFAWGIPKFFDAFQITLKPQISTQAEVKK